jgi:hypothetical protein
MDPLKLFTPLSALARLSLYPCIAAADPARWSVGNWDMTAAILYPFGDPRLVGQGWLRAGSGHAEADLPGS